MIAEAVHLPGTDLHDTLDDVQAPTPYSTLEPHMGHCKAALSMDLELGKRAGRMKAGRAGTSSGCASPRAGRGTPRADPPSPGTLGRYPFSPRSSSHGCTALAPQYKHYLLLSAESNTDFTNAVHASHVHAMTAMDSLARQLTGWGACCRSAWCKLLRLLVLQI